MTIKITKAAMKKLGIAPEGYREMNSRLATKHKQPAGERKAAKPPRDHPFLAACAAHGLPEPVDEYPFAEWKGGRQGCEHAGQMFVCKFCKATRRHWRFDWCWPEADLALEIQGGVFTGGRHVHAASIRAEYEKLNEAQLAGWAVLLVLPEQINSGEALALVARFMKESP